jgi:transposase
MNMFLSPEEIASLRLQHRKEKDRRVADRIKAVLLFHRGWSYKQIAEALFLDEITVSKHIREYQEEKKLRIVTGGSESKLSPAQTAELNVHLAAHTCVKVVDICAYVKGQYGIEYTISGMTSWLKKNGFSFIKPHGVPAKADPEKQKQFITEYEKLKEETPENEPILFCDAVHPTMATKTSYGWIKKGTRKIIKTTGSRTRMNIIGAINLKSMDLIEKSDCKTVNSEEMGDFFDILRNKYTYEKAPKIHIILDNSGYNRSEKTKEYAEKRGIVLHFLPTHSPNLNPIERVWKVKNEYVRNNRFFQSSKEFRNAIENFFKVTWCTIADSMKSRINDKFHVPKTT